MENFVNLNDDEDCHGVSNLSIRHCGESRKKKALRLEDFETVKVEPIVFTENSLPRKKLACKSWPS